MELVPLVRWRPLSLGPSLVLRISGKMGDFLSSWFVQNVLPALYFSSVACIFPQTLQAGLSSEATSTFEHATNL